MPILTVQSPREQSDVTSSASQVISLLEGDSVTRRRRPLVVGDSEVFVVFWSQGEKAKESIPPRPKNGSLICAGGSDGYKNEYVYFREADPQWRPCVDRC